jgi:hypothetical protein
LRLAKVIVLVGFLLASIGSVVADTTDAKSSALLPTRIGNFRQVSTTRPSITPGVLSSDPEAIQGAEYLGSNGARVIVEIIRFSQDAAAYQYLSVVAMRERVQRPDLAIQAGVGTAGFVSDLQSAFFKGTHFVSLSPSKPLDSETRDALIFGLSESLDKGENDIPALIKHLPNPEEAQKNALYLHNFSDLAQLRVQRPVYSALETGRNADAVVASYGPSEVVVVEFNTPQLAGDNDRRIIARIQELWKLGQPAPTGYRRVGNYSVFVFDAPDEQTAKQLIDQVKYEQVVQWLGENPNIYKEAEKRYINTTLGVLVAVLKASGYALVGCLGMGALLGGLLFTYRRAQQKNVAAFSDAGGMLRLNLDELTAETDPGRLLRERN